MGEKPSAPANFRRPRGVIIPPVYGRSPIESLAVEIHRNQARLAVLHAQMGFDVDSPEENTRREISQQTTEIPVLDLSPKRNLKL
jgi:hypothetical protein